MKKRMGILGLCFVLVLTALLLPGCAKKPQELILGTWNLDFIQNEGEDPSYVGSNGKLSFTFLSDGSGILEMDILGMEQSTYSFTWTLSGKTLVVTAGSDAISFGLVEGDSEALRTSSTIEKLTTQELVLSDFFSYPGSVWGFKRG